MAAGWPAMRQYNRGKSEAQGNAEALARRGLPYSEAHQVSVSVSQDWTKRQPRDLREAVRMIRRAYADEVPAKLHDATSLSDDGTPRWTNQATSYIFGNAQQTDAGHQEVAPLIAYYLAPFRATLDGMQRGDEASRKRAAIVSHVTIGSQGPKDAAVAEGVPAWCAGTVAEDAIRSFLRRLSDVKVNVVEASAAVA
jgi:hypothetical protein